MKRGSVFQKDREQELRRRRHGRHNHRSDLWCIDRCRTPRSRPSGARGTTDSGAPTAADMTRSARTPAPDVSLRTAHSDRSNTIDSDPPQNKSTSKQQAPPQQRVALQQKQIIENKTSYGEVCCPI